MTYTPEIIKNAYRESNLIMLGKAPTTDQSEEALSLLNRIISGVYGYEVGDPLGDWPIGKTGLGASSSWTETRWTKLLQNIRLVAMQDTAQTLYLPPEPSDGARVALIDPNNRLAAYPLTIDGNGRAIEDATSVTVDVDGTDRIWFYRADLGKWVRLSALTGAADEVFPFPMEFDPFFETRLAMRLNPRYGRAMNEATAAELTLIQRKLRARYKQTDVIHADIGVLGLTSDYRAISSGRIVGGRMGWMN